MKPANPTRIKELDGLRGLAILMVVLFHFYASSTTQLPFHDRFADLWPIDEGFLGVQLFFMISGYVIFMTLDKSKGILSFAFSRWLRLFPAMAVASVCVLVWAAIFYEPIQEQPRLVDAIPGLLFVGPNYVSAALGRDVGLLERSFWTLFVEVRFYVLASLLYFSIGRRLAVVGLITIAVATTLVRFALETGMVHGGLPDAVWTVLGKTLAGSYLYWFLIGIFCYLHVHETTRKPPLAAVLVLTFLAIQPYQDFGGHRIDAVAFGTAVAIAATFLTICWFGRFKRLFSSPAAVFFGFVSYPLYLVHNNLGIAFMIKADRALGGISDSAASALLPLAAAAFVVLPAYLIARFAEPAIQRVLKKLPPKLFPPAVVPSASK